jgi:hypothetical protein
MYNTYLNIITEKLIEKINYLEGKFTEIDAVIEDIPDEFIIRPSFNFGLDTQFSNLRNIETDVIFTLQIFCPHNSNFDITSLASALKKNIYMIAGQVIEDKLFLIRTIDLIKNDDSAFKSINVQITVNIL